MPAAVDVEDFLARERDLHGAPDELRELARGNLVRERIELAAKAAAHGGGDHADVRRRDVEDLCEQAVHVVRRLRRGPERELSVRRPVRDRGVLLQRQVGIAFEEEDVFADEGRRRKGGFHVAELERHVLVDVGPVAVLVDPDLGMRQRVLDGHQGGQRLVLDLDQLARPLRGLFIDRGDGGQGVAHHPDLVHAERFLVLRHGKDSELDARQVRAGDHRIDARQRAGAARVDAGDACVGMRAPQQLAERHPRQHEVVGILRLARDLRPRIDLGQRLADDGERVLVVHHGAGTRAVATPAPVPATPAPVPAPIRSAANSTASRIFV